MYQREPLFISSLKIMIGSRDSNGTERLQSENTVALL